MSNLGSILRRIFVDPFKNANQNGCEADNPGGSPQSPAQVPTPKSPPVSRSGNVHRSVRNDNFGTEVDWSGDVGWPQDEGWGDSYDGW